MKSLDSLLLPHEKKALGDFQKKMKVAFGRRLKEMRLFGSKVRGTGLAYSDLDVCILLNLDCISREVRQAIYGLAWEALHEDAVDISPLIYTVTEFKKVLARERLIAKTIQKEGIRL